MVKEVRFSISITKEMDERLEQIARERNITKSRLVEVIILEWMYRNGYNKFLHVNFRNNMITVWDLVLERSIDLVYEPEEKILTCSYCHSTYCGHIFYASTLPEVKKKIERGELVIEEF